MMKLRPTKERSPTSMLLEPPFGVNGSEVPPDATPRFGHMKFVLSRCTRGRIQLLTDFSTHSDTHAVLDLSERLMLIVDRC